MCGIIGVLANRPATPMVVEALKRLEYRGYDSAGVATLDNGALTRRRAAGKLTALTARLEAEPLAGTTAIGHTRWATHGGPNEANAHPHQVGPVAVVHNGIIENHQTLRGELAAEGVSFESETDTEIVARLCARAMARGLSPIDAVFDTLKRLEGAFALCFLFKGLNDLIVCARRGSPLAVGYGEGEMFIGSDALALAPFTTKIAYLEEGDLAAVSREGAHFFDAGQNAVERPIRNIAMQAATVDKGGYRHFMAKEIHEQPTAAAHAIGLYADTRQGRIETPAAALDWATRDRVTLVACGTAFYACQVGKWWFETLAGLPAEIDIASEFRYREPPMPEKGVAIFVSQSGETADTLAALRYARAQGQTILGCVNVETSSIARESHVTLPLHVGPEIGVASTKAFTGQLIALATLAIEAARARGRIDAAREKELVAQLAHTPQALTDALRCEREIETLAVEIAKARDVIFLGRGGMQPLAMEGALKLKELTYIHAEGYAAGELKHGPIALIDENTPVVALAPGDHLTEKTMSNVSEVISRGGKVALIGAASALETADGAVWRRVTMPDTPDFIAPIIYAAPLQLLAYHAATAKGTDVDQPRNLAKSVTVE